MTADSESSSKENSKQQDKPDETPTIEQLPEDDLSQGTSSDTDFEDAEVMGNEHSITPEGSVYDAFMESLDGLHIPTTISKDFKHTFSKDEKSLLTQLRDTLEKDEESPGRVLQKPRIYLQLGNSEVALGNYESALELYDKAIALDSKLGDAWLNKGIILDRMGRYQEAQRCYSRATKYNPKSAEAWFAYAQAMDDIGRHNHALKFIARAISLRPGEVAYYHSKGTILENMGKLSESKKLLSITQEQLNIEQGLPDTGQSSIPGHEIVQPAAAHPNQQQERKSVKKEKGASTKGEKQQKAPVPSKNDIEHEQAILTRQILPKKYWDSVPNREEHILIVNRLFTASIRLAIARHIGVDIQKPEFSIIRARFALENMDNEKVMESSVEAIQTLEAQTRVHVLKNLHEANTVIDEFDKVLDLDRAKKLVGEAQRAYNDGMLDTASELIEQGMKAIHDTKSQSDKAKDLLKNSWQQINDAKQAGKDTKRTEDLIKKAREALKKHQFQKCIDFIDEAFDSILSPQERLKKDNEVAMEEFNTLISDIMRIGSISGASGLVMDEIKEYHSQAKAALDSNKNSVFKTNITRGIRSARDLMKTHGMNTLTAKQKMIADLIAVGQNYQADTSDASLFLDKINKAIRDKDYIAGIRYCEIIESPLDEMRKYHQEFDMTHYIEYLEEMVDEMADLGGDVGSSKKQIRDAKRAYRRSDINKVIKLLNAISRNLDKHSAAFVKASPNVFFAAIESMLEEAQKKEIDVTTATATFQQSKNAFKRGNIQDAFEFGRQTRHIIKIDDQKESGVEALISMQSLIFEAKQAGIEVTDAEELFDLASKAMNDEQYELVIKHASKGLELLEDIKEYTTIDSKLRRLGKNLYDLRSKGMDTSPGQSLFNEAQHFKDLANFKKAFELAKKCEEFVVLLRKQFYHKQGDSIITELEQKVESFIQKGMEVTNLIDTLSHAKKAYSADELDKAEQLTREVEQNIRQLEQSETLNRLQNEINTISHHIAEGRSKGARMNEPSKLIEQAQQSLELGKIEAARELVDKASAMADTEKRYREVIEVLKATRLIINDSKMKGCDVTTAEKYLLDARPALEKRDLNTVLTLAYKSRTAAEEACLYLTENLKIDQLRRQLDVLRKAGLHIASAENLLDQAISSLRSTDRDKTQVYIRLSEQALQSAQSQYDDIMNLLSSCKSKIDEYKKNGSDVVEAERLYTLATLDRDRGQLNKAKERAQSILQLLIKPAGNTDKNGASSAIMESVTGKKDLRGGTIHMVCPSCKGTIPAESVFCSLCGHKLG